MMPRLTDQQRTMLQDGAERLEELAAECDRGGTNSTADGCRASAHEIRELVRACAAADAADQATLLGHLMVPAIPSADQLHNMAVRFDHGLGMPGYYDGEPFRRPGYPGHQQRLDATLSTMRQLYEEATGQGFHKLPALGPALHRPPILKGTAHTAGDGWKDTTKRGDVVFVWNAELQDPYAPGQYPRVGNHAGWTASRDRFTFEPATVDEVRELFAAAEAASERRAINFSDLLHRNILAMRAAVVDSKARGAEQGMQWIVNTLFGPGQLPSDDDIALGAQALFDKEVAEHEEFRKTHPAPGGGVIVIRTATISPCGQFRYRLGRRWSEGRTLLFVMLNPSTADSEVDDRTIIRCIGFAQAEEFGALEVVNLFAFRTPKPAALKAAGYPVGPDNDAHIKAEARAADTVCLAWGAHGAGLHRRGEVMALVRGTGKQPWCLALTEGGEPAHPLMLRSSCRLMPFEGA